MPDKTIVVFTYRPIQTILEERGSQAWSLKAANARRCTYIVCTRNRYFADAGPEVQALALEKHGAAFMVGKVSIVEPSPERPERYIVRFDEYAIPDPQPVVWPGARNPVWYVEDIRELGIDPDTLTWRSMPEELYPDDGNETTSDPYFEKFASPLGHVILEFNYLEADAGRMIARLLRQDDLTAGIFAGMISFMEKLKLIQALATTKVQDVAMRREFDSLVKDATDLNIKRNRYIHAEYMPVVGPNDKLMKMLHRRLRDSGRSVDISKGGSIHDLLQPVDDKELKKLGADIHKMACRTRVLAEKYADEVA
jgi:hypothetical protein